MSTEPRFDGDRVSVVFEVEIHAHPVRVEVCRDTIEDHLGVEALTPEASIDFVTRNRKQIIENIAHYTRFDPDLTGIMIAADQLKGCQ